MVRSGVRTIVWAIVRAITFAALLASCVSPLDMVRPRAHPAMDGAVMVGLPKGYCVDPTAGQETPEGSVVLIGRCEGNLSVPPAVIAASVGPAGSAGVMAVGGQEMAAFFGSPAGLATLSARQQAEDVQLLEALTQNEAFLMRLNDRDKGDYWRAVVGVGGHLITLSVTGVDPHALAPAQSRDLLDQTLAALQAANSG